MNYLPWFRASVTRAIFKQIPASILVLVPAMFILHRDKQRDLELGAGSSQIM